MLLIAYILLRPPILMTVLDKMDLSYAGSDDSNWKVAFRLKNYQYCVCRCVCMMSVGLCAMTYLWRSVEKFVMWALGLSGMCAKYLYPLSYLVTKIFHFIYFTL